MIDKFTFLAKEMENIEITKYLKNYDPKKKTGLCIDCGKTVQWTKDRIAMHIRTSCPNATEDDKKKFAKRKILTSSEIVVEDVPIVDAVNIRGNNSIDIIFSTLR